MPIYEYKCKQCGEISEILVRAHSEHETLACTYCGSKELEKILSVSSFTFANSARVPGTTCCGRDERCDSPPCATEATCRRDQ